MQGDTRSIQPDGPELSSRSIWPGPFWPGPFWPWPLQWPESWPILGMGELHGVLLREIVRAHQESRGDIGDEMRIGLRRLHARGLLSATDLAAIEQLTGVAADDAPDQLDKLESLADELMDGEGLGPVALMIASVAKNSANASRKMKRGVAGKDVEGCIGGAGAGAVFGPWGALIGGVVGGALSSAAEAWA
jgi:hypothetical protein